MRKIFRITKNVLTFGLTESIMNMKWMEVYVVARTGRPKSKNPKKTLIGLKLTEEEAAKLREYASKHDIEAKVWSEKNLTKCVAVTQGDEAYL